MSDTGKVAIGQRDCLCLAYSIYVCKNILKGWEVGQGNLHFLLFEYDDFLVLKETHQAKAHQHEEFRCYTGILVYFS